MIKSEYRFIYGTLSECQKTLNQWEHEYDINILNVTAISIDFAMILVKRTRRDYK